MTEDEDNRTPEQRRMALRERQDGDYTPTILTEPAGGSVPTWTPPDGATQDRATETPE